MDTEGKGCVVVLGCSVSVVDLAWAGRADGGREMGDADAGCLYNICVVARKKRSAHRCRSRATRFVWLLKYAQICSQKASKLSCRRGIGQEPRERR